MIKISLKKIEDIDLSYVATYFPKKFEQHQINTPSYKNTGVEQGEHYQLLSYMSSLFENKLILDLGTRDGLSALVLAYNQKNKVISYDIAPKPPEMTLFEHLTPNLEFKQMNVFHENTEILSKASLIFMDLDPHNGVQENEIVKILDSISWKGILIADDIEWFEGMRDWYNNLDKTKYNLTKWGHGSGTALIDFSGTVQICDYK